MTKHRKFASALPRYCMIGVLLLFCLPVSVPMAAANTSARISGVADFLIGRAKENYLYLFERSLKENRALTCYFNETRSNLEIAGLKELLLSRDLWKNSIEKDLNTLLTRSAARYIETTQALSKQRALIWGDYIELLAMLKIRHKGELHALNFIPLDADPELIAKINGFYDPSLDINRSLAYFAQFDTQTLCNTPVVTYDEFIREIDTLYRIEIPLRAILDHVEKHRDELVISGDTSISSINDFADYLRKEVRKSHAQAAQQQSQLKPLYDLIDIFASDATPTVRAVESLKAIKVPSGLSQEEFDALKKHVLFFTQIASSEKPDEVKAILETYTVPAVSAYEKRLTGSRWQINAYLGIGTGSSSESNARGDENNSGLYAPIGIEYSRGLSNGGSFGLLLAPFDFGYPVSLNINGLEDDYELDDVFAPSLSLLYGFSDTPVSAGLAYQFGKKINQQETEERIFIHISFDMPLFVF